MANLRGIWILPINQQYDVIITSNYVIVSIKLCLDVGNDECIILCSFCGCIMSGFEGIKEGGDFDPSPSVAGTQKLTLSATDHRRIQCRRT